MARCISIWCAFFFIGLVALAACSPGPVPTLFPIAGETNTPSVSPTPVLTVPPRLIASSIVIAAVGQPGREVTALPPFISNALYDSLLEANPSDGSLKPALADSWQVSDDARTFTFHLRTNVQWHDGAPLTASDVVYTIKTLSDSAQRLTPAADFGPLADVTALDAQTVSVRLSEGYCPALTGLGTLKILPEHILKDKNLGALTPDQMIGSGPLILKSWAENSISFVRNADYWKGPPSIPDWTYRIYADQASAQAALDAGQADVLGPAPHQIPQSAGATVYWHVSNQFYALAINQERDLFRDLRVRQALAAAIDRPRLAHDLFGSDAELLGSSALTHFWAGIDDANQPAYDPGRARQLLADAGWTDSDGDGILDKGGKPFRVSLYAIAGDPVAEPLAFAVRDLLAKLGIQTLLQLDDRYGVLTRMLSHEYDLALTNWNIPLDPDQHWYWLSSESAKGKGFNVASYSSAQVDDLIQRGNQTAQCDVNARRAIYNELYRKLAEDVPQVFLFAPPSYLVARQVMGIEPSPFAGFFWNLAAWQVGL